MRNMKRRKTHLLFLAILLHLQDVSSSSVECPWSGDPRFAPELAPACECSTGGGGEGDKGKGGGGGKGLSVSCAEANFTMLAAALQAHGQVSCK